MTLPREEAAESKAMERLQAHADALLSLASPAGGGGGPAAAGVTEARSSKAVEGVFECKTCSRRFPSFQALGGHRTSHTRLQARLHGPGAAAAAAEGARAPRVHGCAVCGLEFPMGQALGGHMRRHRGSAPAPAPGSDVAAAGEAERPEMVLDLNYPPSGDDGSGGDDQEVGGESSSEPHLLNLLV